MAESRAPQLAYSELEAAMLDEAKRRRKAAKLISVLQHFLGRTDLAGLTVADIGCSAGFISDELAEAGAARTLGIDIDVPGLRRAHDRFGERVTFVCGDGSRLPFPDDTFDALVFNHIYEHVVDPEAVVAELRRVLSPTGVLYLGLANRFGPIEPHYKLPFLSYLPPAMADRYVRVTRRADQCHERLRSRRSLARMLTGFHLWDYTYSVLAEPGRFAGEGDLPGAVTRLPMPVQKALRPIVPTYIWVATKTPRRPAGPELAEPPVPVGSPR